MNHSHMHESGRFKTPRRMNHSHMHEIGGFKTPRRKFKLIILKIISYCGGVKLNRRSSQQNESGLTLTHK
jgi:hypothetical protein